MTTPLSDRSPFGDRVYLKLFSAQVIALSGTGLSTIALALLAYDLAGDRAGTVLGIALALKMAAYVFIAPVAGGLAHRAPRKSLMILMDLTRAALLLLLPLVTAIWQVYLLIFLINGCAAVFKPIYQALIPDCLPDEARYTRALSMFRIAYDMENILSPALAAILLGYWSFDALFLINGAAFLASALLLWITPYPATTVSDRGERVWDDLSFGVRSYLATPRLRGLLSLYVAVATASAMVIVNSVVYVRGHLGGDDADTARALLAVGAGSVLAALALPRLLRHLPDRTVMLTGGWLLATALAAGTAMPGFGGLALLWLLLGIGLSVVQTPSGRLITASCRASDRTAFFSANFALSHGCWFFAYPLAGFFGANLGLMTTFALFALLVGAATALSHHIWRPETDDTLTHLHEAMEHRHAHVHDEHHSHEHGPDDEPVVNGQPHVHRHHHPRLRHRHPFVIDRHHPAWPG